MTAAQDDDDEILERRAQDLARPLARDEHEDGRKLLLASVGETRVAFDVEVVRRVLPPVPLARIPPGDHVVIGLRNISGELVPVIDLARLIGLSPGTEVDERWVVVIDDEVGPLGVLVDRADELRADPADVAGADREDPIGAAGVVSGTTIEGHLYIDADALLAHPALHVSPEETEETTDKETT